MHQVWPSNVFKGTIGNMDSMSCMQHGQSVQPLMRWNKSVVVEVTVSGPGLGLPHKRDVPPMRSTAKAKKAVKGFDKLLATGGIWEITKVSAM